MTLVQRKSRQSAKPFLKWVGGKAKLVPAIKSLMPEDHGAYYEPFVGGGALFFSVKPKSAHINDINSALIGAYSNVKARAPDLIECLKQMQLEYESYDAEGRKAFYYEARDEYNSIKDPLSLRKSCLLIFLNKTCYNGMYRENSKGGFNVPFGNYKRPVICDSGTIMAAHRALKEATVTNSSFEEAVVSARQGDFVYFDPPYYPLTKTSNFTSYSELGFEEKDQIKLKKVFDDLTKRGCYVMLSNSSTDFIKELYGEYRKEIVLANRAINSDSKGRGKIEELIILNY